jgi:hypothetical protein
MTAPKRPPRWYRKKFREKAQACLGGGLELEGVILEEAQANPYAFFDRLKPWNPV